MPPVFAAIGAIAGAVGAGLGAIGAALGISAGQLALGLLGLAYSIFTRPKMPKAEDGKVSLRQPTPPLRRVYGLADVGGDYFFYRSRDGVAYQGIVLSVGPITEFVTWRLHDEVATIGAGGVVTEPTHFGGKVTIEHRMGRLDDAAYAKLVDAFPEYCDANFRQPGLATALVTAKTVDQKRVQKTYPNGLPTPRVVVRGVPVWDPRDPLQDPEDDPNDPVTWEYRDSPALATLDYLRHWSGYARRLARIHVADFEVAADADDRLELGWDGTLQPRFRIGGRYDLAGIDRKTVLGSLLSAADLWLYTRLDGRIGVKATDVPAEPTVWLTDRDIVARRFSAADRNTRFAALTTGQYTSAAHVFATVDARAWPDGNDPRATGGKTQPLQRPLVTRHRQMRQLMRIEHDRRNGRSGSLVFDLRRLDAYGERYIGVDAPSLGFREQVIELARPPTLTVDRQLAVPFVFVTDLARHTLPPEAEGPPPPVVLLSPGSEIPTLIGFDVAIGNEDVGGQLMGHLVASWTPPPRDELGQEVEWVEWTGSATTGRTYTDRAEPGETSLRTPALAIGTSWRVRGRNVGPSGKRGDWTEPVVRTVVIVDDEPPAPVLALTVAGGAATGTIKLPNDPDVREGRLYRVPTGAPFDETATPMVRVFGAANQVLAVSDTPPAAGTYDYFAVAVGRYGSISEPAGPVTLTI